MNKIEHNMTAVASATGNSKETPVTELRMDMEKLGPPLSRKCCIYRVPSNLRRVNKAAYTPQFVSIGPLHHGDENLKKMEKHKLRYLERFLERAKGRAKKLEDFFAYVKANEERVRRCYAETFDDLNGDQFARMILVDASFIIEYILRSHIGSLIDEINGHQLYFDNTYLRTAVLLKDLTLLENQLPFFVLEELYRMVFEDPPFSKLLHVCFKPFNHQRKPVPKCFNHFTDLVRLYWLPAETQPSHTGSWFSDCSSMLSKVLLRPLQALCRLFNKAQQCLKWFSDCSSMLSKVLQRVLQAFLRLFIKAQQSFYVLLRPLCQKRRKEKQICHLLYSATELHEAGVTFKDSKSECFLDIKFTDKGLKGELEMPCFTIDDHTEVLVRNVMALEQCHYIRESHVCDYFILMDCLINTDKDVQLLVGSKILDNKLGSNQEVASLVNKLGLEIFHSERNSRYSKTIIRNLNKYYEKPHHKRLAALRHGYFNTPWRSASTIAAIILLLLTLAQTICSILSL